MTEAASATKEHTILPEAKISEVVFGSLMSIMTNGKSCKELHHKHK
jgi:hypothetical protein